MPQGTTLTVGISDCIVSSNAGASLATHALGSCIAVAIFDPVAKLSGLLHFMLPDSSTDPQKAKDNPFMFADTGIPNLFWKAYAAGAVKQRLQVCVIGGAQILQSSDSFQIGKRNHLATRKILWRAGVMVQHEDVGGQLPRTVHMDVGTGRIVVSYAGQERLLVGSSEPKGGLCRGTF